MAAHSKSLKGQLLLDSGKLGGSFFHRTVVLICQHDAEGAFGLVLNRPSGSKVGDEIVADLPGFLREQPLYLGGPVQRRALSYLHTGGGLAETDLMANLTVGHSLDELQSLAESYAPAQKLCVFAGYSGWSPGQLDDEMRRDTWLTHPASMDLVFHPEPEQLWRSILLQKGVDFRLLADSPEDPAVN